MSVSKRPRFIPEVSMDPGAHGRKGFTCSSVIEDLQKVIAAHGDLQIVVGEAMAWAQPDAVGVITLSKEGEEPELYAFLGYGSGFMIEAALDATKERTDA